MCYRKLLLAIFIASISFEAVWAQTNEKTKRYDKSFAIQKSTEVNVNNKYGNIHIINWEKDSVRFEVELIFRSSKAGRVEKLFNEIDVRFTQTAYYVTAVSSFPNTGKLWSEIADVTKSVIQSGNEAEINYTIYIPKWVRLKVENRFGNIYTTDHTGETEFKLSNGVLQANHLEGKTRVVVSFGSANIAKIDDGVADLNYSDLELRKTGKLRLSSRSSNMHIDEARHVHLDSRRDKITVEKLESLSGESSFSRIVLSNLENDLLLNTNYGNLNMLKIGNKMKFLQLNASYTSIQLYVHPQLSADLEILYSKKTKLSYPQTLTIQEQVSTLSDNEPNIMRGKIGKEKGFSLKLNLTGGDLSIMEK
ncbi:MAG: hypothetical protein KG029_18720 [Bacteroidetes bacterium]|jgi:hypothetical protein|nr:hypothetical protein [Bacteroidota bacterium]